MLLDGIADGTEDDALLGQLFLKSGLDADRVHDGIDSGVATQGQALLQGDAQLVEGLFQFRVYLAVAFGLLCHGVGVVGDALVVDGRHMDVAPRWLGLLLPVAEGLQTEVKHPLRLAFLLGNKSHDILVQSLLDDFCMDIRREAEFILLFGYLTDKLILFTHYFSVFGRKFTKKERKRLRNSPFFITFVP